ncbi:hypothetical protein BDP55DRAFT_741759 [Colletotrichum godetiae]|uniref:Uncharacterized protein n=1 Tax=Colletotrichum godetiae TaxID=1209918 RepID=A0AAJ0ANI1_9PEZI|nr:uncharacterized protein BDP55DRAFT_741759 [Colletotrichum godetiae]KAK1676499.1 hypothetical protein BDP55DRAFT_741759 [Colletotrichum godetiae]
MKLGRWISADGYNATSHFFGVPKLCVVQNKRYDSRNLSLAPNKEAWVSFETKEGLHKIPSECYRAMDVTMIGTLQEFLNKSLAGACGDLFPRTHGNFPSAFDPNGPVFIDALLSSQTCYNWWLDPLYYNGNTTIGRISAAMDGMVSELTDYFRRHTWGNSLHDWEGKNFGKPDYTFGSEYRTTICVGVRWLWLTFPGTLLVMTVVLLAAVYALSCRDKEKWPIWKSSNLPLLLYDIRIQQGSFGEQNSMSPKVPLLGLSGLKSLADTTVARFHLGPGGPAFVIEESETTKLKMRKNGHT